MYPRFVPLAGLLLVLIGALFVLGPFMSPVSPTSGLDQVTGGVTSSRPTNYGLALAGEQIPITSYIPPCESGFSYCLYRNDNRYQDSNFDSAGLRIKERDDLASQTACLMTPPAGYTDLLPDQMYAKDFSTSVFGPLGDAGAGHYSQGALYRLWEGELCTEFETRVAESQFANYPEGSVIEFSASDRVAVFVELNDILANLTLASTEAPIQFPLYHPR